MTELMTDLEFDMVAQNGRMKDKMKSASKMVLVGGKKAKDVAELFSISSQAITASVRRIRERYNAQATPPGCRLVKVWLPIKLADKIESQCRLKKMTDTDKK